MQRSMELSDWRKHVENVYEQSLELKGVNKRDWTSLKYFSNILAVGSGMAIVTNTSMPMMAMTKNVENVSPEKLVELYENIETITIMYAHIIRDFIDYLIEVKDSKASLNLPSDSFVS